MDISVPLWLLIVGGIVAVAFVVMLASGVVMGMLEFLIKLVVAIGESRKPRHTDTGDYRIDQGREVRFEQRPTREKPRD